MLESEQGPPALHRTTGLVLLVTRGGQESEPQKPSNLFGPATGRSYMTLVPCPRTGHFLPQHKIPSSALARRKGV
uniref:Similar to P5CDH1 n=1 Tax=Arundo donax TaxID=35708 RepID=A0A0A8XN25_ARUDO